MADLVGADRARRGPERDAPSREGIVCGLVLVLVAVAFVVLTFGRLTGPFGDSHDGRNGATWAAGSRALREEGPIASRLGGLHQFDAPYANHPPLMMWSMAASESVLGERTTASRLPILASTLASIGLLYLLARSVGLRPAASMLGTAAAVLTPMVLGYGTMPDTPMFSLAFGLAVLVLWQRLRSGQEVPLAVLGAASFLAALSGWEATAMAGCAGIALVIWPGSLASDRRWRASAALLGGTFLGASTTFTWAWWTYGSVTVLIDQFGARSTEAYGATPGTAVVNQLHWLVENFGPAIVGFLLCAAGAILDRRARPLLALILAGTVGYTTLLWNGAVFHDYWNYWFALPIALGISWGVDALLARSSQAVNERLPIALAGFVVLSLVIVTCVTPTSISDEIERGMAPARALEHEAEGHPPEAITDLGATYAPGSWMSYLERAPYRVADDLPSLDQVVRDHPAAVVVILGSCPVSVPGDLCRDARAAVGAAGPPSDAVSLIAASDLLRRLASR